MKTLFILLLVSLPMVVFSQLRVGATLGYQFTNIGRYDLVETSPAGNALIGLTGEYKLPQSNFYLSAGVLYTTMGYTKSNLQASDKQGMSLGGNIDLHRIGYIQLPVYILYGEKAKSMTIRGGIGFFTALHTGDKLKIKGGDTFGNGTAVPVNKKQITPVLYGAAFQAGVQWQSLGISFHFNQSFNGLYENQSASSQAWKVSGYGLSLAYFFVK